LPTKAMQGTAKDELLAQSTELSLSSLFQSRHIL